MQRGGPACGRTVLGINLGFEGTSDYDTRAFGIGLIPPNTMGAVGTTQYVQLINGSFTVYNKSDGSRRPLGRPTAAGGPASVAPRPAAIPG